MVAHPPHRLQILGLLLTAAGCTSAEGNFTSGLTDDPCNRALPACNGVVGCTLTNQSYTNGKFPGTQSFLVQTSGPSTVEVHFFLENPSSTGSETYITWYESGCTSSFETPVTGKVFVNEAEAADGEFVRSQQLSAPGDHLVTVQSDAVTDYLIKVVVIPTT